MALKVEQGQKANLTRQIGGADAVCRSLLSSVCRTISRIALLLLHRVLANTIRASSPPSAPQPERPENRLLVLQDKQVGEQRSLVFVDNQCLPRLAIFQICGDG